MNNTAPADTDTTPATDALSFDELKARILEDYYTGQLSRQCSLIGRREVLTGKAKFGIFGDGKEVAQLAMARAFQNGDLRSGYYRDQTFMFAKGMSTPQAFFAQLYAHASVAHEPSSGGRSMNGHFGTRMLDDEGNYLDLTAGPQSTADISPTAGQMGRALGVAWASKLYRNNPELQGELSEGFSRGGNEVSFVTIGNASTSEGHFWESINAAGVLQVPLLVAIWDDGYGISVPALYQTTKEDPYALLQGFAADDSVDGPAARGFTLRQAAGWDYPALVEAFMELAHDVRHSHRPGVLHVNQLTQPQGHSTSGSHERYKTKERLAWELDHDCLARMRSWMEGEGLATTAELDEAEARAKTNANEARNEAFKAFRDNLDKDRTAIVPLLAQLGGEATRTGDAHAAELIQTWRDNLEQSKDAGRKEVLEAARRALRAARKLHGTSAFAALRQATLDILGDMKTDYGTHLHAEAAGSLARVQAVAAQYPAHDEIEKLDGYNILNRFFSHTLETNPRFIAIGEDVGKIGDVNQGFAGLQARFGEHRVTDAGIREMSIAGQGLGAALRGLRPLIEIQYLDYLLYALQILSDDVATLRWRSAGGQKAPLIVRTRGHRLEGVWHSGSPMGMILGAVRGILVLVPRNMVQAAGFYNMLLQADEPGIVIECLNGYRLKEALPSNLAQFTLLPGIPDVLRVGTDVTIVTYGSCCRIAMEAALELERLGISVEVVDVQSLLPFDVEGRILESLKKTNRILFLDEDVPGGATAYMMQEVIERQGGFRWCDQAPRTLAARPHRPAYGSDGDYASKPSADDVVETVYDMMRHDEPEALPDYWAR